MKQSATHLFLLICAGVCLLPARPAAGQPIPDREWTGSGAVITTLSDGNPVTAKGGLPVNGVTGYGLVKYTLAGAPVWTTPLSGITFVGRAPFTGYSVFQSIDNVAATTGGGVMAYGREFGTGLRLLVSVSAGGVQGRTFPLETGTLSGVSVGDLIGTPDGGFLIVFTAFATATDTHKDTFAYRYSQQGVLLWTKRFGFPAATPGSVDRSITRAETVINAPGGGFLVAGYYSAVGAVNTAPEPDFDPVNSLSSYGAVTKLSENGELVWQKLLTQLPVSYTGDGPAPGSVVMTRIITDAIATPDGTGYTLVGAGIGPSSIALPPPATALIELAADGTVKRGSLNGLAPNRSFLTPYTRGGTLYYAIGTTSLQGVTNPLLVLISPAELSKIVTQRTFDSPSHTTLGALTTLGDGSLGFSTGQEIYKLNAEGPPVTPLTIQPPTYDCTTGLLTMQVSGAGGTPLEYQVLGLRSWGPTPVFTVPVYQRVGTSFTLEARQSGRAAAAPFVSQCVSGTAPAGALTLLPPLYDCTTGVLTLQVSGAGNDLEYRVAGLRDWGASPVFAVPGYQRSGTTFTLEARMIRGANTSLPFTSACGTPAPPPPAADLTFAPTVLRCISGGSAQILINLVGIPAPPANGIEYKVPGLADWQSNNTFAVPAYQTNGTTFTLYARRASTLTQFTTSFVVSCPAGGRPGAGEPVTLQAVVYPNPVGEQFTVEVRGAARQSVRFDLTDLQGVVLQSRQVDVTTDSHSETFRLRQPASAQYVLRVATGQQTTTVKVLKH